MRSSKVNLAIPHPARLFERGAWQECRDQGLEPGHVHNTVAQRFCEHPQSLPRMCFGKGLCGVQGQHADCAAEPYSIIRSQSRVRAATPFKHLQRTAPNQHQPELPLGARAPPTQARLIGCAPESRCGSLAAAEPAAGKVGSCPIRSRGRHAANGMGAASRQWVGSRMPVWRDSTAQVQSRAFESAIRAASSPIEIRRTLCPMKVHYRI